jgi:phosphoribosylanthranilate isomerase
MAGWIKLCGMSSAAGVAAALEAGADAIGFVFAPSVRRVSAEQAHELALPARGRARCVAVTLHPTQEELDDILQYFSPDVLQSDAEDLATLALPESLELLPVWRSGGGSGDGGASSAGGTAFVRGGVPARLLFEGAKSGTGAVSDWQQARTLATSTQLILAGGLNAGNVHAAIAAVRPFGVDTSSGVESSPGLKSPALIREFVTAARAAFDRTPA